MRVEPTKDTTFKSHLKDLYKKGKIKVQYGLYGQKLTPKNVTDEHLKPRSWGGSSDLSNIALATKQANWQRGNEPIENYLSLKMFYNYCKQFWDINLPDFNGKEYVKNITKTIGELINGK